MVRQHHRLSGHESEQFWEIVKDEEPGMLPSIGLQRVGHNLATEHHRQNKSASCSVISLNLSEVKEKIQMSETDRPLNISKNLSKLPEIFDSWFQRL